MKRLILSVLAGLFLNVLLGSVTDHLMHSSGVYPPYGEPMLDHELLLLAFSYRALLMVLGGYLTASIAKDKARKAVLILGILGSIIWLAGGIALWDYAYPWYNLIGAFAGVPITMIGYYIYEKMTYKSVVY